MITISNIKQFTERSLDEIHNEISRVGGTMLGPTVSLCHECHYHVPAWRYALGNKVYIVKKCKTHGLSHHMIESDLEFYSNLNCTHENPLFNFNGGVLVEASDRCNLECPHCYHLPDKNAEDISRNELINHISNLPLGKDQINSIILTGAEAPMRKDFTTLVKEISNLNNSLIVSVMTNGILFAKKEFLQESIQAGLKNVSLGLNHKDYIDYKIVRQKQIQALENLHKENMYIGYISYTMNELDELDDILKEITTVPWNPETFRIRVGSEIGRNSTKGKYFLSDIFKAANDWANKNGKNFKIIEKADNNIYHIMVNLDGRIVRIIQWCDEKNIDMEELRSGPWCTFVDDGITNFLHQIIRRDVQKNQKLILPDSPPTRYQFQRVIDHSNLDLLKLWD